MVEEDDIQRIGFVGIGDIGFPIANNLHEAGYEVTVMDVDEDAVERFEALGGASAPTPAAVAERSQAVHVAVVNDEQLLAVLDGPDGILAGFEGRGGAERIVVIHSTVEPSTARAVAEESPPGISIVDVAVSGTRRRAERGTLSAMVGGEDVTIERYRPVLEHIAGEIHHMGGVGSGLTVKLLNNSILYAAGAATLEAVRAGREAGLDDDRMLEVFTTSSGDTFFGRRYEFFTGDRARTPAGPTAPIRNSRKTFRQYLALTDELDVEVTMGAVASQRYPSLLGDEYRRKGILDE